LTGAIFYNVNTLGGCLARDVKRLESLLLDLVEGLKLVDASVVQSDVVNVYASLRAFKSVSCANEHDRLQSLVPRYKTGADIERGVQVKKLVQSLDRLIPQVAMYRNVSPTVVAGK
jgi:hypothetical protein